MSNVAPEPISQLVGLPELLSRLASERAAIVTDIDEGFAEIDQLLRSAFTARQNADEAEGRKLLNAALDIECDLTGDCDVLGDLAEAWGVDFETDR